LSCLIRILPAQEQEEIGLTTAISESNPYNHWLDIKYIIMPIHIHHVLSSLQ
jgi:hypothetical protein